MPEFRWRLLDADGRDLRTTDAFASRAQAEEWMGGAWSELATEGAESVVLIGDGREVYRMGLGDE